MLNLLRKFFSVKKSLENETNETKKCLYCLKRVPVYHEKCPHCKKSDFQYDE